LFQKFYLLKIKNKIINIVFILAGIGISVFIFKQFKENKSFLKMTEAEKKKFILDAEKKISEIRNDPKLTQIEKEKAIQDINTDKEDNYTDEEKKAMGEVWVKELQAGNIKVMVNKSDWMPLPL
jgi:hypothetical protein